MTESKSISVAVSAIVRGNGLRVGQEGYGCGIEDMQ